MVKEQHVTSHTARRKEQAEDEEDAAKLQLPGFENKPTLTISEVKSFLESKEEDRPPGMVLGSVFQKTLDYVNTFSTFNSIEAMKEARQTLRKDAALQHFEIAQLVNLVPADAEEAKSLIPSLHSREDYALNDLMADLNALRRFAG